MSRLIEFPLEDGDGFVLIRVNDDYTGTTVTRGLGPQELSERAATSFEAAVGCLRPTATSVIRQLRDLADQPDEVHVEFGFDLHADAGAIIASTGATANFKVALTWRRSVN